MSSTMPIELTPSADISLAYCLRNMRMRSGRAKERPMSMMYLPSVVRYFTINMLSCFLFIICFQLLSCKKKTTQTVLFHNDIAVLFPSDTSTVKGGPKGCKKGAYCVQK